MTDTAQNIAQATYEAMYPRDETAKAMGIEIFDMAPGRAKGRMTVRPEMVNGHGSTHGGMTFSFADTVFAYACNSYNDVTVASGCDITFCAPSFAGDVLIAEAVETAKMGRSGIYDITVRRENGEVTALFRGRSRTIKGKVVAGLTD